jgi:hypothetical protein
MKKYFLFILLLVLVPLNVYAKEYDNEVSSANSLMKQNRYKNTYKYMEKNIKL